MGTLKRRALDWRVWAHGLVGAAIGGGSMSLVNMIVDPKIFNFENPKKLFQSALGAAIFGAALYLSKSPLPKLEE